MSHLKVDPRGPAEQPPVLVFPVLNAQHLLCELSVLDAVHLQKFHMPGGCSLPHESQKFSLERAAPVDLDVSMAASLLTAWLFDVLCGFSNLKLFLAHSQRVQPSCVPSHLTSFNCELT